MGEDKIDKIASRVEKSITKLSTKNRIVLAAGIAAGSIGAGAAAPHPIENTDRLLNVATNPVGVTRELGRGALVGVAEAIDTTKDTAGGAAGVVGIETAKAEVDSVDKMIDIFYPGISGQDRENLRIQMDITKEYMKGILVAESYKNISDHEKLFEDIEKYSGVPKDVLIGLSCAESRGGVDSVSWAEAVGPFQITKPTGEGSLVMTEELDERNDWDKSAKFAAQELAATNLYFATAENPNWGLAVWRWHMGRQGVKEQIENYSANKAMAFTDLREFIRKEHITVFSILQVGNIREALEQPEYDKTPIYVLRVAACASIYSDLKNFEPNPN